MSKVLIYSQEDLDLILELEKEKNEELQQENEKLKADYGTKVQVERDLLKEENEKYKEVIDRKKYLLIEQGAVLKELYSEIDKLQGRIDKAIEYLEEPNRDSFDYSKAKLLDILKEAE